VQEILKKQQIVTMKCLKRLNPNILCKFMRLFFLLFFFYIKLIFDLLDTAIFWLCIY